MSAYITLLTPMTDQECLLAGLADLGFRQTMVEVHASPVPLVGYRGDQRANIASIVIRRQHVGPGSNDVGFVRTPTGFQAIVSDFDRPRFGNDWLATLNAAYTNHWAAKQERLAAEERRRVEEERQRLVEAQRQSVLAKARELGYHVKETREGDAIRLVLVKRTY